MKTKTIKKIGFFIERLFKPRYLNLKTLDDLKKKGIKPFFSFFILFIYTKGLTFFYTDVRRYKV